MNFWTFYSAFASFPLTLGPHPPIHAAKSRFFPSSRRPQNSGNPTESRESHLDTTFASETGCCSKDRHASAVVPQLAKAERTRGPSLSGETGRGRMPAKSGPRTLPLPLGSPPTPLGGRGGGPTLTPWRRAPSLTGLQQISASVSGSLTSVHSLVRKAGTLLGPAAPGPTGRSMPGEAGRGEGTDREGKPRAGLAPPPHLQPGPRRRRPLRTHGTEA